VLLHDNPYILGASLAPLDGALLRRFQDVSESVDGVDEGCRTIVIDLSAQAMDVDPKRVQRAALCVPMEDRSHNEMLAQGSIVVQHEILEELVFPRREVDEAPAARHLMAAAIHH
jgi:hypothetical protein